MSPCQTATIPLAGYRLPETSGLRRKYTRPPERRSAYYLDAYDDRTLFYDCVYLADPGGYLFTAPRFLNLWPHFRKGLRRDGQPVRRARRVTWLRCEQVFVPGPEAVLTLEIEGSTVVIEPRESQAPRFAGRDALVAVSKNNRLDWIAGWANYHVRAHGTRGVVLFDNGSTDYRVEEITARLAQVPGLESALVYSAPFPYGPADKSGRFDVSPRFFQSAMLNIARRDPLQKARTALSIDIDELVIGPEGASIHDRTARHPLGMVTINGHWIYPEPGTKGPVGHELHRFRAVPDRKCNRKWCMQPRGAMSRAFGWAVHQIGGISQNLFTMQNEFSLIHCRACSTGWKANRFNLPKSMERAADLDALMPRYFGAQDEASAPVPPAT